MLANAVKLDPKSLDRLRKAWALRSSDHEGEAAAAVEGAGRILAKFGYTSNDAERIIAEADAAEAAATPNNPFGYSNAAWAAAQQQAAAAAARAAAEQAAPAAEADRVRLVALARQKAAIIARYRSEAEARNGTPREAALDAAVAGFVRRMKKGGYVYESLDGWTTDMPLKDVPLAVLAAVRGVAPMPTTITDAKSAWDGWKQRDADLRVLRDADAVDDMLSMASILRWRLVEAVLATGARARNVAEVLVRQNFMQDQAFIDRDVENAITRDLESIADEEEAAPAAAGGAPLTASAKRRAIERLLKRKATAGLSDREIARRTGASPSTVAKVRAKLAA